MTELDPKDNAWREPKGGKQAYSIEALEQLQKLERVAAPDGSVSLSDHANWMWPLPGAVVVAFSTGFNNGIVIAGKAGEPIAAAADGRVVYAGLGFHGYGNLIIVRHSPAYLSIYSHAGEVSVAEGQIVTRGQRIAEVRGSETSPPKLHFEVHFQGKPVDPQKLLPSR